MDFDTAFQRLVPIEGGLSTDPTDPGNWTTGVPGKGVLKGSKYGISAMTYPDLDIASLTPDQAKAIYKRDWWDALSPDVLGGALVYQMWVFAINAGMGRSKQALQRALGVSDDGNIGPATLDALRSTPISHVLFKFFSQVVRFYTVRKLWPVDGAGWMNRVADCLDSAALDT